MTSEPSSASAASGVAHLNRALVWVRTHQEQFWTIIAAVVIVAALASFALTRRQSMNEQAWVQLGQIQYYVDHSNTQEATKAFVDWDKRYTGSSATVFARFLKGDLLYKTSDYAASAQIYEDLAQHATPPRLRPLALSAAASAEEMAGHLQPALNAAQAFGTRYPDHFMAAPMLIAQARLSELTGNPAAAAAIYDRFIVLYPQSPWTDLARSRQQALSSAPKK